MVGPEIPVANFPLSRKFKTVRQLEQDNNKDGRIEMKPGPRLSLNQQEYQSLNQQQYQSLR